MLYTDDENRRWFSDLSHSQRVDLFDELKERATRSGEFIESIERNYLIKRTLSIPQIAAIRNLAEQCGVDR